MSETINLIKLKPHIVTDKNTVISEIQSNAIIYTYHSLLQLGKYEFYVDLSV